MSEDAPLKNRFRERTCPRRSSVALEYLILFTRIGQNDKRDEILVGQYKLIERANIFRWPEQGRTNDFAAFCVVTFVLKRRVIRSRRTVTRHVPVSAGVLNAGKRAVIGEF